MSIDFISIPIAIIPHPKLERFDGRVWRECSFNRVFRLVRRCFWNLFLKLMGELPTRFKVIHSGALKLRANPVSRKVNIVRRTKELKQIGKIFPQLKQREICLHDTIPDRYAVAFCVL